MDLNYYIQKPQHCKLLEYVSGAALWFFIFIHVLRIWKLNQTLRNCQVTKTSGNHISFCAKTHLPIWLSKWFFQAEHLNIFQSLPHLSNLKVFINFENKNTCTRLHCLLQSLPRPTANHSQLSLRGSQNTASFPLALCIYQQ